MIKIFFITASIAILLFSSPANSRAVTHYTRLKTYNYNTSGNNIKLNLLLTKVSTKLGQGITLSGDKFGSEAGFGVSYKYALNYHGFYLAPGIFADYNNVRFKITNTKTQDVGYEHFKYRYGARVDVGYDVTDIISPYLIAGFSVFHIQSALSASNPSDEVKVNCGSLLLGGGIKFRMTENIDASIEYNIQKINMKNKAYGIAIHDKIETVQLGVGYQF